ncbi:MULTISPECIES: ABC transporter permease [Streptomycetaceae]|uniref:ABC transporter permease n=1 Tax=Streptomycetaceae TaxID=2062 RepID=UPI0003A1D469|nr:MULTISPECIES: ABC transporter permease [Streptomycetaceae]MYX35167.1 ABC transporter permease subunit [Streptomyces sp. SID8377]
MSRAVRLVRGALRVLGLPVLLVLGWWAWSVWRPSFYVPSPQRIAVVFGDVWLTARLGDDVLPSLLRLLAGYVLAALLGVALGTAIGLSARLRAATEPALEFFRAIPPPVLVPLIMLVAGLDTAMKVLVIVSGAIWPVLLNTIEGVRAVDEVLSDTARVYGLRGPARLRRLVLPAASPQIMAGLRQALSIAIILMVIAEMFASTSGIGHTVVLFQRQFQIPEMWSGIVLLGLVGFLLSLAFRALERRVLHWHQRETHA